MSENAAREAAFAEIRQWGDPVLRAAAVEVTDFDDVLRRLAGDMMSLMDAANGAGLAAPQVGRLTRLLVYRPEPEAPSRALVNPVLVEASDEVERGVEGCLSLGRARVWVAVDRAATVLVRGRDVEGEEVEIEAAGMHARVLQHEIDHLDGVLMLDRTERAQKREALRALREGRAWAPPEPPQPGDDPDSGGVVAG